MEHQIKLLKEIEHSLANLSNQLQQEWLSLTEATKYVGVSYNTFIKFRHMGLKVCEIEGIKRVSRKEIDRFLENNSF